MGTIVSRPERTQVPDGKVFQYLPGGKWHRVWWQDWMTERGVAVTHVGSFRRDMPIRFKSEVVEADLCRTCFRGGA